MSASWENVGKLIRNIKHFKHIGINFCYLLKHIEKFSKSNKENEGKMFPPYLVCCWLYKKPHGPHKGNHTFSTSMMVTTIQKPKNIYAIKLYTHVLFTYTHSTMLMYMFDKKKKKYPHPHILPTLSKYFKPSCKYVYLYSRYYIMQVCT